MSKEAMKLALEALESLKVTVSSRTEANVIDGVDLFPKQMAALQKALANEALGKMAENARELGLDYEPSQTDWEAVAADQAMTIALMKVQLEGLPGKEQLPWFKDEIPAAYMYDRARYSPTDLRGQQWLPELSRLKPYTGNGMVRGLTPLYTSPPAQRTWIGLTDEDIDQCLRVSDGSMGRLLSAIEAKLREKNT